MYSNCYTQRGKARDIVALYCNPIQNKRQQKQQTAEKIANISHSNRGHKYQPQSPLNEVVHRKPCNKRSEDTGITP